MCTHTCPEIREPISNVMISYYYIHRERVIVIVRERVGRSAEEKKSQQLLKSGTSGGY